MGNSCGGATSRPFDDHNHQNYTGGGNYQDSSSSTATTSSNYSVAYPPPDNNNTSSSSGDSLYCCTYTVAPSAGGSSYPSSPNPLNYCCIAGYPPPPLHHPGRINALTSPSAQLFSTNDEYRVVEEALSEARRCRDENKLNQAVLIYKAALLSLQNSTKQPTPPRPPTNTATNSSSYTKRFPSGPQIVATPISFPPSCVRADGGNNMMVTAGSSGQHVDTFENIELVEGNYSSSSAEEKEEGRRRKPAEAGSSRKSSGGEEDDGSGNGGSRNSTAYPSQASSAPASGDVTNSNTTPRTSYHNKDNHMLHHHRHHEGVVGPLDSSSSTTATTPVATENTNNTNTETSAAICDEIAELYLLQKKPSESLWWYNQAIQLQPQSPQYIYKKGVVLQQQGKLPEAIHQFTLALQLDPINKAALFNLGTCYLACSSSSNSCRRRRNSSNNKLMLLLRGGGGDEDNDAAALEEENNNIENALKLFEKFLEIEGGEGNADVFNLISQCYEQQQKYVEAVAYLNRAVELDSLNYAAKRHIDVLLKKMNETKKTNGCLEAGGGYRRRSSFPTTTTTRVPPAAAIGGGGSNSGALYQQVLLQDNDYVEEGGGGGGYYP
eukprot:GHVS01007012.1.p1 GENE.GHVS01007012.1~~GHVS01007012.1.p1  ORF type:complete len:607 (+),score=191.92 GHVS01007012.1:605-2425(+)